MTCFAPGEYICPECDGKVYCTECCQRTHKHPQRSSHSPQNLTKTSDEDSNIGMEVETNSESEDSSSGFDFAVSPETSASFEEAVKVMTLAEKFNLTSFRKYQREVVNALLQGKDCLVIQPTGSGKSLCFQFPPVYLGKKAIIIEPTISLMKDQVTNCNERGIKAAYLGSAQTDKTIEDQVLSPDSEHNLIFVTPEWMSRPDKMLKVSNLFDHDKLCLIAIDEAHLFHVWPQFRRSYQELDQLKVKFPSVPILAVTATAPPEVECSLSNLLRTPLMFKESINRPNVLLACEELHGNKDFASFARRVSEILDGTIH